MLRLGVGLSSRYEVLYGLEGSIKRFQILLINHPAYTSRMIAVQVHRVLYLCLLAGGVEEPESNLFVLPFHIVRVDLEVELIDRTEVVAETFFRFQAGVLNFPLGAPEESAELVQVLTRSVGQ